MAGIATSSLIRSADQYVLGNISPSVDPKLVLQHPSDIWESMYGKLFMWGDVRKVGRRSGVIHGEAPTPYRNIGTSAGVAAGAAPGASVSFSPNASDYTNGEIFLQTGDRVLYTTGEMAKATVTGAAGAKTITLAPIYTSVTLPAVGATYRWFVVDNNNGEGFTFNRAGHTPIIEKYSNDLQSIQSSSPVTIESTMDETFFQFGEGRTDYAKYALKAEEAIHLQMLSQAMFVGQSTGTNTGANQLAMTSWDETVETRGATFATGAAVPITLGDLYGVSSYLDSVARPGSRVSKLNCQVGPGRIQDLDAIPRTDLAAGSWRYGAGSGNGTMVDFGFSAIGGVSGYDYFYQKAYEFAEPNTFGSLNFPFNMSMYIAPMAKTMDAITGEPCPMYELLYIESQDPKLKGNMKLEVFWQGPENLNAYQSKVTFVSFMGQKFRCGQNFIKIVE